MDLNKLRDEAYKIACEHGFHDEELSNEHWLCLVVSELMEAVEADRKGKRFDKEKYEYHEMTECQGWLTSEEKFVNVFNRCIKDTVEDELADAVIRLLDLAGYRNIDIKDFSEEEVDDLSESCNGETFTESIYAISTLPIRSEYEYGYQLEEQLNYMIASIFGLANHLDIDLLWHIEQKMKYNQSRERMHGKKY